MEESQSRLSSGDEVGFTLLFNKDQDRVKFFKSINITTETMGIVSGIVRTRALPAQIRRSGVNVYAVSVEVDGEAHRCHFYEHELVKLRHDSLA